METSTETRKEGAFYGALKRNNQKIREDRATSIVEDTQLKYKRSIEDLEMGIKKMRREQENMLDLSPTSADSLVLASDFDSDTYVSKDIDLAVKIKQAELKLNEAKTRYNYLFEGAQ